MKQKFSKALALVICLIMTVMSLPMSAFAAVATDLPENMADHAILRALAYTGYNVEKQKSDGTLYKTNSISSRTPASVLSKIHYGTSTSGFETVTDSSTETGLAPNIARFEKSWSEKGYGRNPDVIRQMESEGIEIENTHKTSKLCTKPGLYEIVKIKNGIPDDTGISDFRHCPSWKAICITILKNDFTLQYMGVSKSKKDAEKNSKENSKTTI